MRIAEPFKVPGGESGFDLWTAFAGLKGIPSLIVHGELSDLLTAETVARMTAENPAMESVTIPRIGHAPTLDEPEAVAAIDALLERVGCERATLYSLGISDRISSGSTLVGMAARICWWRASTAPRHSPWVMQ